jgi:hypothetical protein
MSRKDELVYVPPPLPQVETVRRVYALPVDLVKRIHAYGYGMGHQSEVSAVRDLLTKALDVAGVK